jgi:hypothetical protein
VKEKLRLLRALDAAVASLREGIAAIQRDDYDAAAALFHSAAEAIREHAHFGKAA